MKTRKSMFICMNCGNPFADTDPGVMIKPASKEFYDDGTLILLCAKCREQLQTDEKLQDRVLRMFHFHR